MKKILTINFLIFFLILFVIILLFQYNLNAKKYERKKFMCADQLGPRFEFTLPSFKDYNKKTILKIFDLENRESFYEILSEFKKKQSIIDDSYFFYVVDLSLNLNDYNKIYFEFFPPSTMMLKVNEFQFKNIACWKAGED